MLNEETNIISFAFVRNSWDRWFLSITTMRTNQTISKTIQFLWAKRIHEKDPVYYNVQNELQLRVMSTQLGWIKIKTEKL